MKVALLVVALALVAGTASAHCPNSCSGHGTCGQYDKCTCWANWQGGDCSQRTCAFGDAWATNNVDPHYYAECSNKGLCDRETGECECFPEFDGRACERLSCPNQCSGHGKCRYITDLPNPSTYAGWDASKIQTCICDGGFWGPDCSQRYCPQGDDPLTLCGVNVDQIQRLTIRFDTELAGAKNQIWDGAGVNAPEVDVYNQELALKFTDTHGEVWKTQRISNIWTNTTAITNIQTALEALPNQVIPSVEVTIDDDNDYNWQKAYLITFSDARTSGTQTLLECHDDPLGCMSAGCQPKYKQPRMLEEWVDWFGNAGKVQITPDSILAKTNVDAKRDNSVTHIWFHDVNITVTIHDNDSANTGQFFEYGDGQTGTTASLSTFVGEIYNTYSVAMTWPDGTTERLNDGWAQAIPIDYQKVYIGNGLYVRFSGRLTPAGKWSFAMSVPTCDVVESQTAHSLKENAECSNRGYCDTGTGECHCYEGFYGHNCETQTILV